MGQKLSPEDAELYRRCDEVLHYIWDPIGVVGYPAARDEYYSYLPGVFALVRAKADAEEIATHLIGIADMHMGGGVDRERAQRVAELLLDWRDWIWREGNWKGRR
jgi:hypothetical protein